MLTVAGAELLDRIGGTGLDVGVFAGLWFASVQYRDTRLSVTDQPGAGIAVDALARGAASTDATCKCRRPVATAADSPAPGTCRWRRYATTWVANCDAPAGDRWHPLDPLTPPPAGVDTWSSLRLAAALETAGAPTRMVALAAGGYWHTYRSPHTAPDTPELALIRALIDAGLDALIVRVTAGEWAADPAERVPGQAALLPARRPVDPPAIAQAAL